MDDELDRQCAESTTSAASAPSIEMTAVFASQQGRVVDDKCPAQPDIARLVHSVAPDVSCAYGRAVIGPRHG